MLKERMQRLSQEINSDEENANTSTAAAAASFESALQALQAATGDKNVSDEEKLIESPPLDFLNTPSPQRQLESLEKLSQALTSVIEDDSEKLDTEVDNIENVDKTHSPSNEDPQASDPTNTASDIKLNDKTKTESANCDNGSISVTPSVRKKDSSLRFSSSVSGEVSASPRPLTSNKIKDVTLENFRESLKPPSTSKGKPKVKGDIFLESLRETLGQTPSLSRHSSLDKRKEFTLESLSTSEARAMSGLLRQASLEKVGSSRIGNVTVTSANRNRVTGNYTLGNSTFQDGRITTPEGRLVVSVAIIYVLLNTFGETSVPHCMTFESVNFCLPIEVLLRSMVLDYKKVTIENQMECLYEPASTLLSVIQLKNASDKSKRQVMTKTGTVRTKILTSKLKWQITKITKRTVHTENI